jgi:hypothetical protein
MLVVARNTRIGCIFEKFCDKVRGAFQSDSLPSRRLRCRHSG